MKCFLIPFFVASTGLAYGQMFFDAGIKAAFGPTLLFNQNIFDDSRIEHEWTNGHNFGAKIGAHWGEHSGVTFDYMMAKSSQTFNFGMDATRGMHDEVTWKHHDLLLMYRHSSQGVFVEFGPKLSIVREVVRRQGAGSEQEIEEYFAKNYKSIVLGFGTYLIGNDVLTLQPSLRLHWSLDDFISEDGMQQNYPQPTFRQYSDYTKTKVAAVQFNLELNYVFGRFGKLRGKNQWRLFLFK